MAAAFFNNMGTLVLLILLPVVFSQSWDYNFAEFVTEEIPIWKAVLETEDNGFWDLGDGRSLKAVVFELGGCSRGHPCAASTGLPYFYPEGCDPAKCVDRFPGDPWYFYHTNCELLFVPSTLPWQRSRFGNMTQLSNEWFNQQDTSCLLRYSSSSGTWEQGEDGVTIVLRAQGFNFPAQRVIVSEVDSVDESFRFFWPDVRQEAAINFAMVNDTLLKPTNTYASSYYDTASLTGWPGLTEINVTLRQEYLDALDLGAQNTWVMGSIAGLTLDKVHDYLEFKLPEYSQAAAAGAVWAEISSEFDTWVSTMSLGRKGTDDRDQRININPLKAIKRCKCSQTTSSSLVVRRTSTALTCTAQIATKSSYVCDNNGLSVCNEEKFTAWDKSGEINYDGTVPCTPRNSTRRVFLSKLSAMQAPEWSTWPSSIPTFSFSP